MKPLSGDQYLLRAHGYEAQVASVGATVRALRYRGRDLVVPFGEDEIRPAMRGALLAPWPNRTGDGTYTFAGVSHELPLNETEHRNAAHGLAAWLDFRLVESTTDRIALTAAIQPQPGYPWRVRLHVALRLGERGLEQHVTATNETRTPAPYGLGGHPYLVAGSHHRDAVDDWSHHLPAARVLLADDRRLPVGEVGVGEHADGVLDFRLTRRIGTAVLDHAFTGLTPDGDGRRSGLAVEPMTCPPDALRSGRDLVVLPPGEAFTTGWRLTAISGCAHRTSGERRGSGRMDRRPDLMEEGARETRRALAA